MSKSEVKRNLKTLLKDISLFCAGASGITLRRYQMAVAHTVIESVLLKRGLNIVVMFPRQSGKNELQAHIETYLLAVFSNEIAEMVKISPTWKPQSLNAMQRLERVLMGNLIMRGLWRKENGYCYCVGKARLAFLSGSPDANIVGATASALLEVDEAQDVRIEKYDREIAPMAASTNATRVFWGTAWTSQTLLARELLAAQEAQERDGLRRVFVCTADEVSAEVPDYKKFVSAQVLRFGRNHPMIRTQYYSESIDEQSGMFPATRQAMMHGSHVWQDQPRKGCAEDVPQYAFLIDVGGEDHAESSLSEQQRDATAMTIVEADPSGLDDEGLQAAVYRVVHRRLWVGTAHTQLYAEIRAMAFQWQAKALVVDATGIGAGLASFLERNFPDKVVRYTFNRATKSHLGWQYLALVESGRYLEYTPREDDNQLQDLFYRQLSGCDMKVLSGPEQRMQWGVPASARDPLDNSPLHDDLILSAALCVALDEFPWQRTQPTVIVPAADPLLELDQGF
ncbi:MAG: hypothetical protein JEZ00_07740 [Anaerolineaceae bacterium]|nr:hypothetical protein [Anaerolineaceae bacterium]